MWLFLSIWQKRMSKSNRPCTECNIVEFTSSNQIEFQQLQQCQTTHGAFNSSGELILNQWWKQSRKIDLDV